MNYFLKYNIIFHFKYDSSKRGNVSRKDKKILKLAKGFRGLVLFNLEHLINN
jgi:hypothetical protein